MDPTKSDAATSGSASNSSRNSKFDLQPPSSPFLLRHGRRYLRDAPYPLPVDLPELQRQNLLTCLASSIFGSPLCSPFTTSKPLRKVLEIACGSAYWSSLCHSYITELGYTGVGFTGVDIVQLSPNLKQQGLDWRFVEHDLRKVPLPFEDEEFDLVVMKDLSLVIPQGAKSQRLMDECIRVLRKGGSLEIWECDHIVRTLLPHPPTTGHTPHDKQYAEETGTYLISPSTPFGAAQNKYLQDFNGWLQEALDRRKLSAAPCARITPTLLQEPETLAEIGYRRVAIPLGEFRWEQDETHGRLGAKRGKAKATKSGRKGSYLTLEQASYRHTALLIVIQLMESLEPLLKEVSGKNQEEWQRWWGWMMTDLLENRNVGNGECLEIGAWWATKV